MNYGVKWEDIDLAFCPYSDKGLENIMKFGNQYYETGPNFDRNFLLYMHVILSPKKTTKNSVYIIDKNQHTIQRISKWLGFSQYFCTRPLTIGYPQSLLSHIVPPCIVPIPQYCSSIVPNYTVSLPVVPDYIVPRLSFRSEIGLTRFCY